MEPDDVISLQDYLDVLWRQRWVVAATTALVVLAAVGSTFLQDPVYEAQADIVVFPADRIAGVSDEIVLDLAGDVVQNERLVLTSRAVASQVATEFDIEDVASLVDNRVRVEAVEGSRILQVTVSGQDPVRAAQIADRFGEIYLDQRRSDAVEQIATTRANLDDRFDRVVAELEDLEVGVVASDGSGIMDAEDRRVDARREILLRESLEISSQLENLNSLEATLADAGSVSVRAEVATSPIAPRPWRTGALALVLGLLLGVGAAFLRDHADDRLHDERTVARAAFGRPIVGRIPRWRTDGAAPSVPALSAPSSGGTEAYRELLANVRFLLRARAQDRPTDATAVAESEASIGTGPTTGRTVLLSAAGPGAGASTTAANLAVVAARTGLRTVLVDADLRTPSLAAVFNVPTDRGLSAVLAGAPIEEQVARTDVRNLVVLGAGPLPSRPSDLLTGAALRGMLERLLAEADLIVIDSPSVLRVADALSIGPEVDLTLVVGRAQVTGARQLAAAFERLEQAGTTVAGTVVNAIDAGRARAFDYHAHSVAELAPPASEEQLSSSGASEAHRSEVVTPPTTAVGGSIGRLFGPDGR